MQQRYHSVEELQEGQMSEIWLHNINFVFFEMNLSIQSMNQDALGMLSKLCASSITGKMMSPDQENTSKLIYMFSMPLHLTHNLQNFQHTLHILVTTLHHPWQYIIHSW
jgi:hypothetical protein